MSYIQDIYATEKKDEVTYNPYLQTLVDPWNAPKTLIPDTEPTDARYARRLMTDILLTGQTDYLIHLTPYNPRIQASQYRVATVVDNCSGFPNATIQWPGTLRPLQMVGDWVWNGELASEEKLADNYSWARTQSVGYQLISDTQPIGVFTLSGQIHAENAPTMFDFRQLEASELFKYRRDDNSLCSSVRLTDGITGVCEPVVTPMLPIGTNAVETGGNRVAFRFVNKRQSGTGGAGTLVAVAMPNFSFNADYSTIYCVPGEAGSFPFGMTGATYLSLSAAGVATTTVAVAYIGIFTHENADGSPSATPVCHFTTKSEAVTLAWSGAINADFRFVARAPILGIMFSVYGLGNLSANTQAFRCEIVNTEYLQLGFAEPFTLINVEKTDPAMRIAYSAVTNVEVIPEASIQSVARDVGEGRPVVRYHVDDLEAAMLPFRNKAAFSFRTCVPKSNVDYYNKSSLMYSPRPVLKAYAAGWWNTIKDLASGAWEAIKPGLKEFAISRIGKASAITNGYASSRRAYAMKPGRNTGPVNAGRRTQRRPPPPDTSVQATIAQAAPDTSTAGTTTDGGEGAGTMVIVPDRPEWDQKVRADYCDVLDLGVFDGQRAYAVKEKVVAYAMRRRALPPTRGQEEVKIEALPPPPIQEMAWPTSSELARDRVYRRACFINGCPRDPMSNKFGAFTFPVIVFRAGAQLVFEVEGLVSDKPVVGVNYDNVVVGDKVAYVDGMLGSPQSAAALLLSADNVIPGGIYLTINKDTVESIDVIEDDSYSLGLYACVNGYPTDQPFTGTLEDGDPNRPFGAVGEMASKAEEMEAKGRCLFVGVGSDMLPGRHPMLQNLKYREVGNIVGLEYELTCSIILADHLVMKKGAYFEKEGAPLTEKHRAAEVATQVVSQAAETWEDMVAPSLAKFGSTLASNLTNQYNRILALRKLAVSESVNLAKESHSETARKNLELAHANTKASLSSRYNSLVKGLENLKIMLPPGLQIPETEMNFDAAARQEAVNKGMAGVTAHGGTIQKAKTAQERKEEKSASSNVNALMHELLAKAGANYEPPPLTEYPSRALRDAWGQMIQQLQAQKRGLASQQWAEELKRALATYPVPPTQMIAPANPTLSKSQRNKPAWKRNGQTNGSLPAFTLTNSPVGGNSGSGGSMSSSSISF